MKKTLKIIVLTLTLITVFALGVFADSINEQISALLNKAITITFNGEPVELNDASGARVYPITYNGTTYLPARAICNLTKTDIKWDGATNTVMLGQQESAKKEPALLVKQEKGSKYNVSKSFIVSDSASLNFEGTDGIQEFQSGVGVKWTGITKTEPYNTLMFDVEGYEELTFTVGCKVTKGEDEQDGADFYVFDEDGNKIAAIPVKQNQLISTTLKLNGVKKVGFGGFSNNGFYDEGFLYAFNPTLK